MASRIIDLTVYALTAGAVGLVAVLFGVYRLGEIAHGTSPVRRVRTREPCQQAAHSYTLGPLTITSQPSHPRC